MEALILTAQSFDLKRIFLGSEPPWFLLEILFRTSVLFLFLLGLLRLLGPRSVGQITLFEFALIIALGSAAGDPMFYPDVPLLHGMAVITVIVLFQRVLVALNRRNRKVEEAVEGKPMRLVYDGKIDREGLKDALLTRDEFALELRQAGIEHLGQVWRAYMEVDGKVSAFLRPVDEVTPGLSMLPYDADAQQWKQDQTVPESQWYACNECGSVAQLEQGDPFPSCPECDSAEWTAAVIARGRVPD